MKMDEKLYKRIWKSLNKHPLIGLLGLNALADAKGCLARLKYRDLKREPTIENIESNTKYFARTYGLSQALYFETITDYAQDTNFREQIGGDKEYLHLWYLAAIDFLRNNVPKDASILDICCGLGQFFVFLKKEGFYNFSGVDDSLFQPRIIKAAKKFLNHYKVKCRFYDFNISYPGYYNELYKRKFDVVTQFGVIHYSLFDIVLKLLKPKGYYIFETVEKEWGGGMDR
jgi:SAM-dependent methyltransferase